MAEKQVIVIDNGTGWAPAPDWRRRRSWVFSRHGLSSFRACDSGSHGCLICGWT